MSNPFAPPDPDRPPPRPVLPVAPPSPAPSPPPDPAGVRKTRRLVNRVFLLFLASLVVWLLPAPWGATSVVFALIALVVAVRAVVVGRRARAGRTVLVATSTIVVTAAFGVVVGSTSLLVLPAQMEYQRCRVGAVTVAGKQACTTAYENAVDRLRTRLTELQTPP